MIKTMVIGLLLKATNQASPALKKVGVDVEQIGVGLRKTGEEMQSAGRRAETMGTRLVSAARGLNRIGVEAEAAARKVKPLTDKLDKVADYGKTVAEHTLIPGGVMAGTMGYMIKDFADLEAARNSLVVGMMERGGKVDAGQYAGLSGLAEQLGKDYKGSSLDFYRTFRILIEQGITAEKILGGVGKAVADFSAVTGESYENVAFKLAKFHDGLGIAASDMPKFAEAASKARFAFGLNTEELYTALPYMTAGLKALKIQGLEGADTVLRISGIMARAGIPASEIGTSLGQVINRMADFNLRLGKNSKTMKEIRGILTGTGIEMNFWDKKGNFLGPENMIRQFEKLNRLSPQRRMEVQKGLFGDVGGRGVSILGDGGVKGWKESERMMQRQASLSERVLSIQETLVFMWDSFTGTVKTFRAEVGNATTKVIGLKGALDGLNDTFGGITSFMRNYPRITAGMVSLVVIMTGLLLVVGAIGAGIAGIAKFASFAIGGWARLGPIFTRLAPLVRGIITLFRLAAYAVGATAGWLVAAVVGVGAALYQVWKHWNTLKQPGFFKDLLSWLKDETLLGQIYSTGVNIGVMLWKGIRSGAHSVWSGLKGLFFGAEAAPRTGLPELRTLPPLTERKSGSGAMAVHYSPQISVPGGNPGQLREALSISFTQFEQFMLQYQSQQQRRAF